MKWSGLQWSARSFVMVLTLLSLFVSNGFCFKFERGYLKTGRSTSSLRAVAESAAAANELVQIIDVVRQAAVPQTIDSAIAIGLAEAVAGGVGALLSRGVANAVGDKKVDTVSTKILSTSAFFGTRSVIRNSLRLLGFPRPIALVIASVAGSLALESTKAQGRGRQMQNASVATLTLEDPTLPFNNMISWSEIGGDVTKWILFDLLSEVVSDALQGAEKNLVYFALGAVSAVGGNFVKELTASPAAKKESEAKSTLVSYSQAAVEGGVLFLFYGICLWGAMITIPSTLDQPFFFNRAMEEGEREIQQLLKD